MMKKLSLLAVLISANIYAADWQYFGTDTSGGKWHMDMENSLPPNEIWIKIDYDSNERINSIIYNRIVEKYSVSCKKKKIISLSKTHYNNGEPVLSNDLPSKVESVIPGSLGELMLKKACSLPTEPNSGEPYIDIPDVAQSTAPVSSGITLKTVKQCNQAYDDLAYFIEILDVCSAENNIDPKIVIQTILSGCQVDVNRLSKSTQKVTKSINKLVKKKGVGLFCQEEMNYFHIVTNKYGISYDEK